MKIITLVLLVALVQCLYGKPMSTEQESSEADPETTVADYAENDANDTDVSSESENDDPSAEQYEDEEDSEQDYQGLYYKPKKNKNKNKKKRKTATYRYKLKKIAKLRSVIKTIWRRSWNRRNGKNKKAPPFRVVWKYASRKHRGSIHAATNWIKRLKHQQRYFRLVLSNAKKAVHEVVKARHTLRGFRRIYHQVKGKALKKRVVKAKGKKELKKMLKGKSKKAPKYLKKWSIKRHVFRDFKGFMQIKIKRKLARKALERLESATIKRRKLSHGLWSVIRGLEKNAMKKLRKRG